MEAMERRRQQSERKPDGQERVESWKPKEQRISRRGGAVNHDRCKGTEQYQCGLVSIELAIRNSWLVLPFQGSTDFGNVSFVVPGIHPYFYIGSDALNHTEQYTEAAGMLEVNVLASALFVVVSAIPTVYKFSLLLLYCLMLPQNTLYCGGQWGGNLDTES